MKKTCNLALIALLVIAATIAGCKKEDDSTNNNNNPPQANPLCDGVSGSTAWLPLKLGNQWKYTGTGIVKTVQAMDTFSGVVYYRIFNQEGSANSWTRWYRVAGNGDVMYRDSNGNEYLYLPTNPSLNQQWPYPAGFFGTGSRVVESLTDSVKTSLCTYYNCMKIQEYNSSGSKETKFYYKRGVGKIRQNSFSNYDLKEVTFK